MQFVAGRTNRKPEISNLIERKEYQLLYFEECDSGETERWPQAGSTKGGKRDYSEKFGYSCLKGTDKVF